MHTVFPALLRPLVWPDNAPTWQARLRSRVHCIPALQTTIYSALLQWPSCTPTANDGLYAALAELWSKYHEHGILQRSEANLWWEEQYAEWDPCKKFDDMELDRGYWAVVQSRLNISADQIWTKLKPCMQHSIMSARPVNGTEEAAPV